MMKKLLNKFFKLLGIKVINTFKLKIYHPDLGTVVNCNDCSLEYVKVYADLGRKDLLLKIKDMESNNFRYLNNEKEALRLENIAYNILGFLNELCNSSLDKIEKSFKLDTKNKTIRLLSYTNKNYINTVQTGHIWIEIDR